jgi:hypothetical protein
MKNANFTFSAHVQQIDRYNSKDGEAHVNITGGYHEDANGTPTGSIKGVCIVGVPPFHVVLSMDGVEYAIQDVLLPGIMTDINGVQTVIPNDTLYHADFYNLPTGLASVEITDATIPNPQFLDANINIIISPPFATLNGVVHTGKKDTTWHFELGPASNPPVYGTVFSGGTVSGSVDNQAVSMKLNVNNLLPGTTYDYRLVQTADGEESKSENSQFTTPDYFYAEIKKATEIS